MRKKPYTIAPPLTSWYYESACLGTEHAYEQPRENILKALWDMLSCLHNQYCRESSCSLWQIRVVFFLLCFYFPFSLLFTLTKQSPPVTFIHFSVVLTELIRLIPAIFDTNYFCVAQNVDEYIFSHERLFLCKHIFLSVTLSL